MGAAKASRALIHNVLLNKEEIYNEKIFASVSVAYFGWLFKRS